MIYFAKTRLASFFRKPLLAQIVTAILTTIFLPGPSFAEPSSKLLRPPSDRDVFAALFPRASLIDCNEMEGAEKENCDRAQKSIIVMARRLWSAKNFSSIENNEGEHFVPFELKAYSAFELKDYYRNEAAPYAACLRDKCGSALVAAISTKEPLALTWTDTYLAASCVFDAWSEARMPESQILRHPSAIYRDVLGNKSGLSCGFPLSERALQFLLWHFPSFPPHSVKF